MSQVNTTLLTQEQKLQAKADKLKQQLSLANKKLAQIKTKQQSEERRKRTRKLISVGGIFDMVNPEFLELENNATLYRLIVGVALQLDELTKQTDDNSKSRLATLEQKAKQFLDNRDQQKTGTTK
ncbi:MAG: hypothetical protein LW807_07140 [Proteobacteria bacterium]|jgi:hypothetical protein|nr:hypothetical protein [Pseudomonadota bacterium]